MVLGAVLAPTDAVVVENLLRQAGLPPNLRAAIVGESLFNDGAGVVLFLLALGVTEGDGVHIGHGQVLGALLREIAGGALLGIFAGWLDGVADAADQGRRPAASDFAGAGARLLSARDSLPTCRARSPWSRAGLCLGSPSPRFGMTPDTRRS